MQEYNQGSRRRPQGKTVAARSIVKEVLHIGIGIYALFFLAAPGNKAPAGGRRQAG